MWFSHLKFDPGSRTGVTSNGVVTSQREGALMLRVFQKAGFIFVLLAIHISASAFAIQVVSEPYQVIRKQLHLNDELKVYEEPSLIFSSWEEIYSYSEKVAKKILENHVLTPLEGSVCLVLYEPNEKEPDSAETRTQRAKKKKRPKKALPPVIPVRVCGDSPYNDTFGFIFRSDLKKSLAVKPIKGQMAPSTPANEIPEYLNE